MRALLLLPLLALAVAACGGSSATSSETPPPSPAATSSAPPSASASSAGRVVTVVETEFKLDPASVSVPAGTVTFQLVDRGQAPHDLHIAPKGSTAELGASQRVGPGGNTSFTVTLAPGTYDMWCGVPGHRQAGMAGTITVT